MTEVTESLLSTRSEALRKAAQELMNATEGYDPNVKQVIRAVDALRGAADEIDRLGARFDRAADYCARPVGICFEVGS